MLAGDVDGAPTLIPHSDQERRRTYNEGLRDYIFRGEEKEEGWTVHSTPERRTPNLHGDSPTEERHAANVQTTHVRGTIKMWAPRSRRLALCFLDVSVRSGLSSRTMGALAPLDVTDPLHLDLQLTDEERLIRDSARAFASSALAPRVKAAYRAENFDRAIMKEMGDAGLLGATVKVRQAVANLCCVRAAPCI